MANTKMFIPDKIKVGYQDRKGTYTGKLAYVIYFDNKGVLRKEKSWESWRDKKISPQEFPNEPIEGFVLNKGVGGARESWSSWDTRNEYIRVYDPRDFEFEISVANLLFILQENSSIKGKGLEGEFVYAWNGTELVLLPIDSAEYKACKDHTARQSKKIIAKDVKVGFSYLMKNEINVLYLGKYPYNNEEWHGFNPVGNRHIFLNLDNPNPEWGSPYIVDTGFTKLAEHVSSTPLTTYPDELDRFKNSKYYGEITAIELEVIPTPNILNYYSGGYIICDSNMFYRVRICNRYYWGSEYKICKSIGFIPEIKNNKINLPPSPENEETISESVLNNFLSRVKFYSMKVITPQGTKIEVKV